MCKKCVVADEYTRKLRYDALHAENKDKWLREDFIANGGEITFCPPFTPGGVKVYSPDERPERGLIMTKEGPRVDFKERE